VFYCGIDLSARASHMCVVDESLSIRLQQKSASELSGISNLLLPFKPDLKIVVDSTFNWYWLVDGLLTLGFDVSLAHTQGTLSSSRNGIKLADDEDLKQWSSHPLVVIIASQLLDPLCYASRITSP
jgi:hypothetical protein